MQISTFTWIIAAMLVGNALAMPRGGGGGGGSAAVNNDGANGNGNSNGQPVPHSSPIRTRRGLTVNKAAAASGTSTDGQTCEGNTNNILNTGVCKNGKCNIEIPPNELSRVASADCE